VLGWTVSRKPGADVTRKSYVSAGRCHESAEGRSKRWLEVRRVEIEAGKIVVFAGKPDQRQEGRSANEWDDVR
jgi:hypothetical protein